MTTIYDTVLDYMTAGRALPDGCTHWGLRTVNKDFTSRNGYRWPFPGNWATAPAELIRWDNLSACPKGDGDGICVATQLEDTLTGGCRHGGIFLLVAYSERGVLGGGQSGESKVRVSRAYVVEAYAPETLVENVRDLRRLDLTGANLGYTVIPGRNLEGAMAKNVYMGYAKVRNTNLKDADLWGACALGSTFFGCDLKGATVSSAIFYSATIHRTNFSSVNLRGTSWNNALLEECDFVWAGAANADFRGATFQSCDLTGIDLSRADLTYTKFNDCTMKEAGLYKALYNHATALPDGINPEEHGMVWTDG